MASLRSRTTATLLTLCSFMAMSSPSQYLRWDEHFQKLICRVSRGSLTFAIKQIQQYHFTKYQTNELQVLVFCFVDLLATDFLLAAIVTYVVSKGLSVFRFSHLSVRQVGSVSQNLFTVKNSVLLQSLIPGKLIWFSGLSLAAPTWQQRLWLTGDFWYKVESS